MSLSTSAHAALAILVGLQAVNGIDLSIVQIVHDIWSDRMTTHNAIVQKGKR